MSFSFGSIAHAMASVANDIVKVSKTVATALAKVKAEEPVIEAISSVICPQAVEIERAAFMALGLMSSAAMDTNAAASANGLNLQLDQQTISDFKAIGALLKQEMAKRGVPTK